MKTNKKSLSDIPLSDLGYKHKTDQHTPTPWRIGAAPGFKDSDFPTNIISEKGAALADTNRNVHLSMEEKIANAALIVHAVNSHEALLVAAKALLKSTGIRDCPDGRWSTADDQNYRLRVRLEKAVAQAEK